MTGIICHKIRKISRGHVRHTYLADVGTEIDIPLMDASKVYENSLLNPPYPKIRYFEFEIDEQQDGGTTSVHFRNIVPVRAELEPDRYFLIFRIRRGTWTVTERIQFPTETGEAQWLYTDDFNILFLSSGGRYDHEMLATQITGRLSEIAQSYHSGKRILSEFENQLECRTAIKTLFDDGIDEAFRDAVVYQDFGQIEPGTAQKKPASLSGAISGLHGSAGVSPKRAADLRVNISEIEDLGDLSWLGD